MMTFEAEYGTSEPIRFAEATMHDGEGNTFLCKCGKPAGSAIIGKEASIAYCSNCSPTPKYSAEFVYRPPIKPT